MELRDLIASADIVGYIGQFVDLEQRGEEFWGLSPFKDEKTPSFSVRPDPPCFYDYSSGIGGNIFTFIRHYFHCSAADAVDKLKEYMGCDGEIGEKYTKLDATIACKKFAALPRHAKEAKSVVLPDSYMSRYEKRDDKLAFWRQDGISDAALEHFQVYYDAFSDRLVYPIRNSAGQIVNIGGRTLDPDWKEKKLRKYTYFQSWGTMDVIYGLSENREEILRKREIILFEGAKSVMIAYGWGIRNCGALLTSHLNPNQLKILAKLGVRTVFALDRDVDIRKDHNIKKLRQYTSVEYIFDARHLLDEKDSPVDRGADVFMELYNGRYKYR